MVGDLDERLVITYKMRHSRRLDRERVQVRIVTIVLRGFNGIAAQATSPRPEQKERRLHDDSVCHSSSLGPSNLHHRMPVGKALTNPHLDTCLRKTMLHFLS